MKDFFTYFTDIKYMEYPFETFSISHISILLFTFFIIYMIYRYYIQLSQKRQLKFQKQMAIYFLIEEIIYSSWLLWKCHDQVIIQLLPLELCSICVYMNVVSALTQKKTFCFFSAVIGMIAGSVAMIYPANISGLYPIISYRTINFYMLHGSFILFSLVQLKDERLLQGCYMKRNYIILCSLFTVAFVVNLMLDTQYMFIGIPSKIGIIASVYQVTGVVFFLPVIYIVLFVIQYLMYGLLKCVCCVKKTRFIEEK